MNNRLPGFPRSWSWMSVVAALVLTCALTPLRAEIVERIVVKVNGEIFTKTQLEERQTNMLRRQTPPVTNDADLKKQVDAITPQILVDVVDEMLLLQRGKELGIKMTDDQFADILKRLKTENKIETEEQFQAAMKQEGFTLITLRTSIEQQMIVERVEQTEVFSHINVTEAEERKYYDEHKNDFMSVPTVTFREILVKVGGDAKGVNVAADEEARQRAESIRARALKGESFEKLAELSDSPSKANGGLIGPIKRSDLDPNFAKLLETMKPGDISEPIRIPTTGYDVVKLEAAAAAAVPSFDDARSQIADRVYASKQQREFDNFLKKLRSTAIIDWKVPELKKLYEAQIARGRTPIVGGQGQ